MLTKDLKDALVTRFEVDGFQLILQPQNNATTTKILRGVVTPEGACKVTLDADLIEQLPLGTYHYQLVITDADSNAIMTFPACKAKFNILERISASGDIVEPTVAMADSAITNLTMITDDGSNIDLFDADGNYIRTTWMSGDIIYASLLNRIENALYAINEEMNSLAESDEIVNKINETLANLEGSIVKDMNDLEQTMTQQMNSLEENVTEDINDVTQDMSALESRIERELADKADMDTVWTMANMGQDVKEAMTGGSVAIVGDNTIVESNIVNGQVTPIKTSFIEQVSVNSLDTSKVVAGSFINSANGVEITHATYASTGYIEVSAGDKITLPINGPQSLGAYYDSEYKFVSGIAGNSTATVAPYQITVPDNSNICYVRFSMRVDLVPLESFTVIIGEGVINTLKSNIMLSDNSVLGNNIAPGAISPIHFSDEVEMSGIDDNVISENTTYSSAYIDAVLNGSYENVTITNDINPQEVFPNLINSTITSSTPGQVGFKTSSKTWSCIYSTENELEFEVTENSASSWFYLVYYVDTSARNMKFMLLNSTKGDNGYTYNIPDYNAGTSNKSSKSYFSTMPDAWANLGAKNTPFRICKSGDKITISILSNGEYVECGVLEGANAVGFATGANAALYRDAVQITHELRSTGPGLVGQIEELQDKVDEVAGKFDNGFINDEVSSEDTAYSSAHIDATLDEMLNGKFVETKMVLNDITLAELFPNKTNSRITRDDTTGISTLKRQAATWGFAWSTEENLSFELCNASGYIYLIYDIDEAGATCNALILNGAKWSDGRAFTYKITYNSASTNKSSSQVVSSNEAWENLDVRTTFRFFKEGTSIRIEALYNDEYAHLYTIENCNSIGILTGASVATFNNEKLIEYVDEYTQGINDEIDELRNDVDYINNNIGDIVGNYTQGMTDELNGLSKQVNGVLGETIIPKEKLVTAQNFNAVQCTPVDTAPGVIQFTRNSGYTWSFIYTDAESYRLQTICNNGGFYLLYKLDGNKANWMLLNGEVSSRGYTYSCSDYTKGAVTKSSAPYCELNDVWTNLDSNTTVFIIEKEGDTITISASEDVGTTVICTINGANVVGMVKGSIDADFVDSVGTQYNYEVLEQGIRQEVDDIKEDIEELQKYGGGSGGDTNAARFNYTQILVAGDSITEANFRCTTNWHGYLKGWLKLTSVYNEAKSGTGLVREYGGDLCLQDRIASWPDEEYSMILIMGNMNDYSSECAITNNIGTFEDDPATMNKTSLYGALHYTIQQILAKYPTTPIGWIISTPRKYSSSTAPLLYGKNSIFEPVTEVIKEVCGHYSIPVLDLYHESGLRPWIAENNAMFFSCNSAPNGDGVHPNDLGQELMARKIYEFVKQYM